MLIAMLTVHHQNATSQSRCRPHTSLVGATLQPVPNPAKLSPAPRNGRIRTAPHRASPSISLQLLSLEAFS